VLNVAYPLAPVGCDAAGGAEQVLSMLDRALVRQGYTSIVIGCEGSQAAGRLVEIPRVMGEIDESARRSAQAHAREAIRQALARWPVDVVHLHGVDFPAYTPAGVARIATLHLPASWYPADAFRSDVRLVCVSQSQQRGCPVEGQVIANGVDVAHFETHVRKREFALALGRICPEKGYHLALDAAASAGMALALAGDVFRYPAHVAYFDCEIVPRLDARRRFLGPVGLARKRRLLASARCLVVPSLVAETSSLVAMEALASGTPVIAFRSGALPEIVEDGKTGFLVGGVEEMAKAMRRACEIDPEACRAAARQRFRSERMCAEYLALYVRMAEGLKAARHVA
jgi:glycosyltransferase involved in cell wall biosynthesis